MSSLLNLATKPLVTHRVSLLGRQSLPELRELCFWLSAGMSGRHTVPRQKCLTRIEEIRAKQRASKREGETGKVFCAAGKRK